jgi:hypothetical protein
MSTVLGDWKCKCSENTKHVYKIVAGKHVLESYMGLRDGRVAGSCECGNEPSGSIKFREFLDKLGIYWFLKKNSAPRS